ncbi:hypothetical protein EVAR_47179_1 [Eumeta japonica]|uniref:Uncharacterized protein n=1 Tax=Eumeta variegata TaxID=151549 RepID=A0A4C1WX41_EUMVA|nr:hypothetical protein EVAR_47179_1 [Eumeta japonica]
MWFNIVMFAESRFILQEESAARRKMTAHGGRRLRPAPPTGYAKPHCGQFLFPCGFAPPAITQRPHSGPV